MFALTSDRCCTTRHTRSARPRSTDNVIKSYVPARFRTHVHTREHTYVHSRARARTQVTCHHEPVSLSKVTCSCRISDRVGGPLSPSITRHRKSLLTRGHSRYIHHRASRATISLGHGGRERAPIRYPRGVSIFAQRSPLSRRENPPPPLPPPTVSMIARSRQRIHETTSLAATSSCRVPQVAASVAGWLESRSR